MGDRDLVGGGHRAHGAVTTGTTWPHPIGTRVRAWPGLRPEGRVLDTRTRSHSWLVGGVEVVAVEGYPGGIALTHVEVIQTTP